MIGQAVVFLVLGRRLGFCVSAQQLHVANNARQNNQRNDSADPVGGKQRNGKDNGNRNKVGNFRQNDRNVVSHVCHAVDKLLNGRPASAPLHTCNSLLVRCFNQPILEFRSALARECIGHSTEHGIQRVARDKCGGKPKSSW